MTAGAADAEAARCAIGGAVSLGGRNQVLYGNRCASVRAEGASNLSVVKNAGDSISLKNVSLANLSGNAWNGEILYDDRAELWGSDLPGVLDGQEHAGADPSRLPHSDKTRFESSVVREKVYRHGEFVSLNQAVASAAGSADEELVLPAGVELDTEGKVALVQQIVNEGFIENPDLSSRQIPAKFAFLPELPMTPGGKLDGPALNKMPLTGDEITVFLDETNISLKGVRVIPPEH